MSGAAPEEEVELEAGELGPSRADQVQDCVVVPRELWDDVCDLVATVYAAHGDKDIGELLEEMETVAGD